MLRYFYFASRCSSNHVSPEPTQPPPSQTQRFLTMLARSNIRSAAAASPRVQRAALVGPIRPVPNRAIVRPRQVTCQGLFGLGLPELAVIAGVAALIFGPSKLPELGRGLGQTVKSFQTAANEFNQASGVLTLCDCVPKTTQYARCCLGLFNVSGPGLSGLMSRGRATQVAGVPRLTYTRPVALLSSARKTTVSCLGILVHDAVCHMGQAGGPHPVLWGMPY